MTFWKRTFANVEEQLKWAVLFALVLATADHRPGRRCHGRAPGAGHLALGHRGATHLVPLLGFRHPAGPPCHGLDPPHRPSSVCRRLPSSLASTVPLGSFSLAFVALVNLKLWPMYGVTYAWKNFSQAKTFRRHLAEQRAQVLPAGSAGRRLVRLLPRHARGGTQGRGAEAATFGFPVPPAENAVASSFPVQRAALHLRPGLHRSAPGRPHHRRSSATCCAFRWRPPK